ncbi:unnamed protein product [Rhizoctonia solani]|uniref:Uncharacterized protein n=1 Tax=Rhizoctonia solani TaxID=456999 RepID=A0A8H2XEB3_9AGAM|nr:uncharacterized protein RhiXN_08467 [Rhizoctonia solani]QRW23431.1 hypothetical protein RhiXN_08467 [Rhizoctonia solani]CAE6424590.1 unnamed protein product [Rhizoctonia solani]
MLARVIYLSAIASLVAAHGTITAVNGANGITGAGMGIDPNTPRDGTKAKPFQQDTSIIRDREIDSGKVGPCGRTTEKAASSAGLPSATADGEIQMTLHQVNQDGAGPYTCDMSGDGGATWQSATVTKNVPGAFLGLSTATAEDFPLNVRVPANMQCAGGPNGDACVVRCRNATPAGPFGSCAAFTTANAGAAGGNKAAAAAAPSTKSAATGGNTAAAADENKQGGGIGGGLKKLLGGRSYPNRLDTSKRALSKPEDFSDEDAKDAELEAKLIAGLNKRAVSSADQFADQDAKDAELEEELIADLYKRMAPVEKKRVIRSRVVGSLSGYWI